MQPKFTLRNYCCWKWLSHFHTFFMLKLAAILFYLHNAESFNMRPKPHFQILLWFFRWHFNMYLESSFRIGILVLGTYLAVQLMYCRKTVLSNQLCYSWMRITNWCCFIRRLACCVNSFRFFSRLRKPFSGFWPRNDPGVVSGGSRIWPWWGAWTLSTVGGMYKIF